MVRTDSSDVLIIGGGVIGLSIARELHKGGVRRITILEKGLCGTESSWAAAGMLGPQAEADEGGVFFEMQCESRGLYPDFAAELRDETGIDVELDRSGTLYLAFSDEDAVKIGRRFDWQTRAGLAVERLTAADTLKAEPAVSPEVRESLFFPGDWQVENRKLLEALRKYAELNDIDVRENIGVTELITEGGGIAGVKTDSGDLYADQIVLATGAWTSLIKLGNLSLPGDVKPIRGQMLCFRPGRRGFRRVIYSTGGYIVPRADGRILAGSTSEDAGFDKAVAAENSETLHRMAMTISPVFANIRADEEWAGLRPMSVDGLPILGELVGLEGVCIATAHYRNGILLAPLTAKLVAAKIMRNDDSPYLREFGPDRFSAAVSGKAV